MARILVTSLLVCFGTLALAALPEHGAVPPPPPVAPGALPAPTLPPGFDPETGIRSYSQHAFTKIRQGSMLHSDLPDQPLVLPELRGSLAVRRDAEIIKHFTRLAELEVIASLATANNDVVLAERAEEVRRKETQRFNDVMQDLKQQVWEQQVAETP